LPASTGLDGCQQREQQRAAGGFSLFPKPFPRLASILYDGWPLEDDQIKRIKEANDIVAVIGEKLPLRAAGRLFVGLCPFHDDHRPSFQVDPQRQSYRCWPCDKYGDVISFVQEFEHVSFHEALELLARRAGITLEKSANSPHARRRALMLDVVRWAAQQFHECLLSSPLADEARRYLDERGLEDETVRAWGLGFAPRAGDWLVRRAGDGQVDLELLEDVGLIAQRTHGPGCYDRFRDRIQFPICDVQSRPVGFGGRILPSSPLADRGPKYYNSSDTPLFSKSELLYGLDRARRAIGKAGYVAVVEGYTDVLMAHQHGVEQVVATMGTALNARHVRQLRQYAPRVVLVFDADAGGNKGVDSALELFASQGVDLAIATLPAGLDPCDLLIRDGGEAFCQVLDNAVDALEFKLNQVTTNEDARTVEGQRRAVEAVLGVLARIPVDEAVPGADKADVKTQLMVSRIARRFSLKEETVWARLDELRSEKRGTAAARARPGPAQEEGEPRRGKAAPEERQLLSLLLADESLVRIAAAEVPPEEIQHSGLRCLLDGLYALLTEQQPPTLNCLRGRVANGDLLEAALKLQEIGREERDREYRLRELLDHFAERRVRPVKQKLQNQLHSTSDHSTALELFRQLQNRNLVEGGATPPSQP
jgi:DNA primase